MAQTQLARPSFARRYGDIVLAFLVVLIVGMMIVPLPTPLLDILIASNIALGVLMMLVAMYIKDGLAFASFPTLLLVTTLYRLALNVSSTRLILLQADAGDVIRSFGQFVVRGNYVVGAIVFAILTLIQFLVIAKGSERVAEVGARFALDAMPGKQMSIDADVRSGALSQEEARRRRKNLQRESQFYGAMDGAMKFVKGDAIAGIVITVVNIVGGLAIGVMQHDMSAVESLRTYGLLTIGDGLVSQIPALLISTAAGLVVTRVAAEDEGSSLGAEIGAQIFGNARAMGIAAIFLLALAIIPGLPALPFLVLAVVFFATSRTLILRERASNDATAKSHDTGAERDAQKPRMPLVVPFEIALGSALTSLRPQSERSTELSESLAALRETLFQDLGINLPTLRIELDESLPEHAYRISIHEVPVATYTLGADQNPSTHIRAESERWLRRRAHELIGLQETQTMLDQLDRAFPALVRNVVPKPVSLPQLSDILRRLLEEGVSVRPLREILEALAVYAPIERDPVALTELVRGSLRRAITHRHADGHTLNVYLVDPAIEDAVREAIQRTSTGTFLALAPDIARDITGAIKKTFTATDAPGAVLLTQPDVRRFFRRLIEADFPDRAVLSYPELAPEITVQPVDRITI